MHVVDHDLFCSHRRRMREVGGRGGGTGVEEDPCRLKPQAINFDPT